MPHGGPHPTSPKFPGLRTKRQRQSLIPGAVSPFITPARGTTPATDVGQTAQQRKPNILRGRERQIIGTLSLDELRAELRKRLKNVNMLGNENANLPALGRRQNITPSRSGVLL